MLRHLRKRAKEEFTGCRNPRRACDATALLSGLDLEIRMIFLACASYAEETGQMSVCAYR
jgi:hypothetical protein